MYRENVVGHDNRNVWYNGIPWSDHLNVTVSSWISLEYHVWRKHLWLVNGLRGCRARKTISMGSQHQSMWAKGERPIFLSFAAVLRLNSRSAPRACRSALIRLGPPTALQFRSDDDKALTETEPIRINLDRVPGLLMMAYKQELAVGRKAMSCQGRALPTYEGWQFWRQIPVFSSLTR